jgi:hypothetical protein
MSGLNLPCIALQESPMAAEAFSESVDLYCAKRV